MHQTRDVNGMGLSIENTDRQQLVVEHAVMGAKVHDARLVATMKAHGITQILTFNVGDFARFSEADPWQFMLGLKQAGQHNLL